MGKWLKRVLIVVTVLEVLCVNAILAALYLQSVGDQAFKDGQTAEALRAYRAATHLLPFVQRPRVNVARCLAWLDREEEGRPEQPTSESGYVLAPASVVLALAGWFPLLNMAGMFLREQPVPWLAEGEPPVPIVTGVVVVALSAYLGTLCCLSVAAPRSVGPAVGAGILGTLLVPVTLPFYGEPWWAASLAFLTGSLLASLPARLSHRTGPARGWPAFWWSAGCALAGNNWRVMAEGATERDWRRLWWLWGCFCLLVLGACAWIWTLAAAHAWEITGHGPG